MDRVAGHNPAIPESIRRVARQLPAVRQGYQQIAENQLLLERLAAYAAPEGGLTTRPEALDAAPPLPDAPGRRTSAWKWLSWRKGRAGSADRLGEAW